MGKTSKDIWVDKVIDSTSGMQKAVPSDGLFHKIEQRVSVTASYVRTVPLRTVSLAAASIILLVVANIFMLGNTAQQGKITEKSKVDIVVDYYGLNENIINY